MVPPLISPWQLLSGFQGFATSLFWYFLAQRGLRASKFPLVVSLTCEVEPQCARYAPGLAGGDHGGMVR